MVLPVEYMWRFNITRILFGVLVFLSSLHARAAGYSTEMHFYNWGFSDLGTTQLGGRLDWRNFELTVENRGVLSVAIGGYADFNEGGSIVPHFSLGIQLLGATGTLLSGGNFTCVAGMGIGFPLFNFLGGKVGIGWDYYLYVMDFAGQVFVQPFIPLTLSFYFN